MRGERMRIGGPSMTHAHGRRFGGGAGGGPPFGGPRGGRRRRGEIRTAVLAVLADGPAHGYEIIRTLEERSGGLWRPSPGSVYPMLQLLEDENLVRSEERDGKRTFELTEAGQAEAAERIRRSGGPPWQPEGRGGESELQLREELSQLHAAARQVAMFGSAEQVERAKEIAKGARRELYQLLAED